jgi:NAD(P)-dependent dehydrogenase (short-subunit alcohol dehydrogenase family)
MKTLIYTFALLVIFTVFTPDPAVAAGDGEAAQKAVLVTGASTGIGRKITETLAANGHFVYAGARKQKDIDELNAIENVQAVRLDVTIQSEIDAAVKFVEEGGRGLYGLVNNAGVGAAAPMIEVEEDEVMWVFDVNVFGVYRVTKAFAPLIIKDKGRIATIGSISGIGSGPLSGTYSMSKHAVEAYTDSLAAEMERFDVQVSVIEPGNYRSEISKTGSQRMLEKGYMKEGSAYKEDFERRLNRQLDRSQYKDPDEVADAALHALFSDNPKRRYMVVPDESEAAWTIGTAVRELVQLNQDQPYEFSRDEIMAMIDEAMGESKK